MHYGDQVWEISWPIVGEPGRGRGYLFLTVMSLKPLQLTLCLKALSFFSVNKNPAPTGDVEGQISNP